MFLFISYRCLPEQRRKNWYCGANVVRTEARTIRNTGRYVYCIAIVHRPRSSRISTHERLTPGWWRLSPTGLRPKLRDRAIWRLQLQLARLWCELPILLQRPRTCATGQRRSQAKRRLCHYVRPALHNIIVHPCQHHHHQQQKLQQHMTIIYSCAAFLNTI